jgi:Phage head-tail joining protein
MLLDDTDLQAFSDLATDLALKDSCAIQRQTRTERPSGGANKDYTTINTVPCLVAPPRKVHEDFEADQFDQVALKTILFPRNTDVIKTDLLVISDVTYRVESSPDPISYEVLRTVYAYKLPGTGV